MIEERAHTCGPYSFHLASQELSFPYSVEVALGTGAQKEPERKEAIGILYPEVCPCPTPVLPSECDTGMRVLFSDGLTLGQVV